VGLPDEVLVRIFSFLPKAALANCARTCKRLYNISFDESLWKRADLGEYFKLFFPGNGEIKNLDLSALLNYTEQG
jgi:F-box-like